MKNASAEKTRRLTLTAQVNILIVLITLGVSLLVVAINAGNYYKAILEPSRRRLAGLEIDSDQIVPYLAYFSQFFGTQEMFDARDSLDTDDNCFPDWLDSLPSFAAGNPEYSRDSLFFDKVAFDQSCKELLQSIDLDIVCAEVVKEGTVYRVNVSAKKNRGYSTLEEFGREGSLFDLDPAGFSSPKIEKVGSEYLLIRCVSYDLGGSEGRIWLVYDQTGEMNDYYSFLMRSVLYVIVLTAAASVLSVWLLNRYVTRPVSVLAEGVNRFRPGDDGTYCSDSISTAEIKANNELGDLSREIRSMQTRIVEDTENLRTMTAEKERIITELNLAAGMQASMLPGSSPAFPDRKEFDLAASMTPARDVGGDFYDYFMIDDDHLALMIADVSGKGVPAALFMMISEVILKNNAMIGKSAGEILSMTNNMLCDINKMTMFVTVWLGILEISTGKLSVANAGHEYPALMKGGCFHLYMDEHNTVIGLLEGMQYQEYELQLEKGDKLFVYTDGITEANNAGGKQFGTERLIDVLNSCAALTPKELISGIKNAVNAFAGEAEQFDDLTMLCLEYKGPQL